MGGYSAKPLPMREVVRREPLDIAAEETFVAWLREPTTRTLQEFVTHEWTNEPRWNNSFPPPTPPSRTTR